MKRLGVFLLCAVAVLAVGQRPKPKLNDLKSNLKNVKSKKGTLQRQLSKTRKAVRAVRGDLQQIDGRLDQVETALAGTKRRLSAGVLEQGRLGEDLKEAEKRLATKREQVRERLRWMYVHQDRSVVTALVGVQDLSEVASRTALYERIARADRDLFESYGDLRDEVAAKKRRQDALVVSIAALRREQEGQQAELADTRQDKAAVLTELRTKQSNIEQLLRTLDREENAIEARIAAYYASAGRTSGLKPFTGRFSRPVSAPITSGFGMRFHPILKRSRMHNGIDFGARHGTPIQAAADGVVIASTYGNGFGNMIILDHGGGISTLYGHCSRLAVAAGQRVKRGQVIGYVGSTGLATGPHLHFEVRVNGRPVNPMGRV